MFSFVKTGWNKRKCYAGCLYFGHFILGGVYKYIIRVVSSLIIPISQLKVDIQYLTMLTIRNNMSSIRAISILFVTNNKNIFNIFTCL
jgi:hypothetical protein